MYVNRVGWAIFGSLEIECLEVYNDCGELDRHSFFLEGFDLSFSQLVSYLNSEYPSIGKLMYALGKAKFLDAVLDWNPSEDRTRDSFYRFLAAEHNDRDDW